MARAVVNPDAGAYNRPALIQKPAPYSYNGQGGNANAGTWTTVRGGGTLPLMVSIAAGNFGRGLKRAFQFGQQYPTATHWAEMHYGDDAVIDGSMTLLDTGYNRRYQVLGAVDHLLAHQLTILALVEWQAQGSR